MFHLDLKSFSFILTMFINNLILLNECDLITLDFNSCISKQDVIFNIVLGFPAMVIVDEVTYSKITFNSWPFVSCGVVISARFHRKIMCLLCKIVKLFRRYPVNYVRWSFWFIILLYFCPHSPSLSFPYSKFHSKKPTRDFLYVIISWNLQLESVTFM